MTTIAYRDGVLAADTMATGNSIYGYRQKIYRAGKVLIGACGNGGKALAFSSWVRRGMSAEDRPDMGGEPDNCADGYVYLPDGLEVSFWGAEPPQWLRAPFYAHGSGSEIAIGAMAMGATAEEAVRAAMQWDHHSGGEVTVLRSEG